MATITTTPPATTTTRFPLGRLFSTPGALDALTEADRSSTTILLPSEY